MNKLITTLIFLFFVSFQTSAQSEVAEEKTDYSKVYQGMKFRNIGPFRGGRSVAATGVPGDAQTYYMGSTGGGIWKTTDAGITWKNISDSQLKTGSVGALAVAPSDANVIYAGMGEHAVRGVMTSHGDGIYKSTDAGKTWTHLGLQQSRHIAEIRVHPNDPDRVYIAVQGALHGDSEERGVYISDDGGETWHKTLYVDETTGAADISMDVHNPRILYASMWDHRRYPWQVRSGGDGSGMYKSKDGGQTWEKLKGGLPEEMGKSSIDVSAANPEVVYANIEAAGEKGGVYRSNNGGKTWKQTTKDRITVARAWYYIEIFADPTDENKVYVLNAPMLKSIDGGKTFSSVSNPHGDQHHLWINPEDTDNIILANDGGACITFNGGQSWSSQQNQPTCQFYRIITDNQFPYYVYGGQQDNSSVITKSRTTGAGIGWKDWFSGPGCESAFLAFDPDHPTEVFGGCYQGNISVMNWETGESRDIMAYPVAGLAWTPSEMKYRFNWNAPIVASPQDPTTIYHAGNVVLKTTDSGVSWEEISPDLTRNDKEKQVDGGAPYTNEGAGGEVYNTISYLEASEHDSEVLWAGSDCGLVHVTRDGGEEWNNVSPPDLGEALINSIDVSPHDPASAYLVATKYKFNDFSPMIYKTDNYGRSWEMIVDGIAEEDYVRVVREDLEVPGLLYAGTETGLYVSFNDGDNWQEFQLNLPVCPITDLTFRDNDLVVATSGRSFWILDDLSPLQQGMDHLDEDLVLFSPKATYRVSGSGRSRPGTVLGQNPASGITFDYYLPEKLDSQAVEIEIVDVNGVVLRQYSSIKDPDRVSYPGGPPTPRLLPAKKGVNRFNWDMRRSPIPGVRNVFMLGGYSGALAPPGDYTIRLKFGDEEKSTLATLKPDPRTEAKPSDYNTQYDYLVQLENMVSDVHSMVSDMRAVKGQLKNLAKALEKSQNGEGLRESSDELVEKIVAWEEQLIQPDQKTFQDVINFPNKLNAEIGNLLGRWSSFDPKISNGGKLRYADLKDQYDDVKSQWKVLMESDIPLFNQSFKESGLDVLNYPAEKEE